MTAAQRKSLNTLLVTVGAPLLVALLAWGATKYDESKLDTARYVADSIRRESDHAVLMRIDGRVRDMYCANKPAGCQ